MMLKVAVLAAQAGPAAALSAVLCVAPVRRFGTGNTVTYTVTSSNVCVYYLGNWVLLVFGKLLPATLALILSNQVIRLYRFRRLVVFVVGI
jgi:hypothetical protein